MIEKKLGKITSVKFGKGGYQDAMFGLSVQIEMSGSTCIGDFKGTWVREPEGKGEAWRATWADVMTFLMELLDQANVEDVADLKGIPVEVTLEGQRLGSWRILTEVI